MAWTTPRTWVAGEIVTAAIMNTHVRDNLDVLYQTGARTLRPGSASATSAVTFGSAASFAEHVAPLMFDVTDADDEGTPQVRIVWQLNVTAANGCTSLTPRSYLGVLGATGSTGSIGSNVELVSHTALTGSPIATGWLTRDSTWTNLSALVTSLSSYGVIVGQPVYRLDAVTANPTIGRMSHSIFARIV